MLTVISRFQRLWFIPIAVLALMTVRAASAQETRATILGQVRDSSGAVVPTAAVKVTNVATNVSMETKTNPEGQYVLPFLVPGTYSITAGAPGFKTSLRENIELRMSDRMQLDLNLEIGSLSEQVEVKAEQPLLQAANANLGQVMDTRRVAELPIAHGSAFSLIYLSPGVLDTYQAGNMRQSPDALQVIAGQGLMMGGSPGNTADFTMDGIPNTQTNWGNSILNLPPIDAVGEFKVETAFDASQGHTSGVIMNFSLKGGTNQPHGTAYIFLREPSWNANDFQSNKYGLPRSEFTYKRWGASSTGPIYIPKVYDGRNRSFYSYSFEYYDAGTPDGFLGSVPTPKEATGDFSALLAIGPQYQIYDPSTITAAGGGRFSIKPFTGNIIPPSRISPIATAILKHFPAPNAQGQPDGTNNFANTSYFSPELYYNHIARLDHNVSDKQRLYARVSQNQNKSGPYRKWWSDIATGQNFIGLGPQVSLDHVYVFSPTLVTNVRYGLSRYDAGHVPDLLGYNLSQLGFGSNYTSLIDPTWMAFPRINTGGLAQIGREFIDSSKDNVHSLFASVLKQHGSHTLNVGADLRAYRKNFASPGRQQGVFNFDTDYTRGPFDNSPGAPGEMGQGLAALLLGQPTSGYIDKNDSEASQSTYWAFYLQDNWRVNRKLTLNLGLRWEYEGPTTERFNRSVRGFDAKAAQPIQAQAQANYALHPDPALPVSQFKLQGGLLFAGVGGQPRTLWDRSFTTFAPRFGFAYQAAPKVVVRGGFGIFPIEIGITGSNAYTNTYVNSALQSGFSEQTSLVPTLNNGQTFVGTLANPYPNGVPPLPGASQGIRTFLGQGIVFYDSNAKRPYVMRWSLNTQALLPGQFLVEVGYVGSKSIKLQVPRDYNALPDQYLSTSPFRDQATIDYLSENVTNPMAGLLPGTSLNGSTIPRGQLLRPFPQFTSVIGYDYQGYSWYHALQVRAERRFGHGFSTQVNYTFSKQMDAMAGYQYAVGSYMNAGDPSPYRIISYNGRPHQFSFSGIFEFPVGRGKPLLGKVNRVANAFVGGWQIGPMWQLRSGWPIGFGNVIFTGDIKNIALPSSQRSVTDGPWFNTAGFERDPAKQLASNLRTFPWWFSGLRTPGFNLWDLGLIKKTRIHERHEIDFRAEFFNLFNHPTELGSPDTEPTSSTFGQNFGGYGSLPRNIQLGVKYVF
jgi:hypothetical protein